jgi:hypothetical protein
MLHGPNHLVAGALLLCTMSTVGERLEPLPHQMLSVGTSFEMHAFHDEISIATRTKHMVVGGWYPAVLSWWERDLN